VEKGLRAMMDAYQSRLYWHIRRLIVDHDQAQDVLQDTFIKAYQNIHQFKSDSKLYTWLYRIATNEALQQLNKMNRMKKTDEDAEYYMQNLVADNAGKDAEEIQILLQKRYKHCRRNRNWCSICGIMMICLTRRFPRYWICRSEH
jgi:RNA polymerase sigma-70 factor (ECF subfamily)